MAVAVLGAGLLTALPPLVLAAGAAATAAGDSGAASGSAARTVLSAPWPGRTVSGRVLEAGDGHPRPALLYRPAGSSSEGVVLLHDLSETARGCSRVLAEALCERGFEVLVLEAAAEATAPGDSLAAARWRHGEPAPAVEEFLCAALRGPAEEGEIRGVVCFGRAGTLLPQLLSEIGPLRALAWIAPPPGLDLERFELPEESGPLLILAASQDRESCRAAEDLFVRLSGRAQLRLFRQGEAGCALAAVPAASLGLAEWLAGLLREDRRLPAMASPDVQPPGGIAAH